jgi:transcription elongation factor Elf1
MSPRKAHHKVEKHIVAGIRNKRAKLLSGPYPCIQCGEERLRVVINEEENTVRARCRCGYSQPLDFESGKEGLDYYNDLMDK